MSVLSSAANAKTNLQSLSEEVVGRTQELILLIQSRNMAIKGKHITTKDLASNTGCIIKRQTTDTPTALWRASIMTHKMDISLRVSGQMRPFFLWNTHWNDNKHKIHVCWGEKGIHCTGIGEKENLEGVARGWESRLAKWAFLSKFLAKWNHSFYGMHIGMTTNTVCIPAEVKGTSLVPILEEKRPWREVTPCRMAFRTHVEPCRKIRVGAFGNSVSGKAPTLIFLHDGSRTLDILLRGVVRECEMNGREGKKIGRRNVESATGRSSASVCVTIKWEERMSEGMWNFEKHIRDCIRTSSHETRSANLISSSFGAKSNNFFLTKCKW